ncbi:hypothetical protein O1611_g5784 [Lasiodiplodia mahajangana]|uniref:Uncharacterized protein n=1 Tax=Lasiodiplodia mahajangana TaxID=1108764 RepID=A0ACC2JJZ7_9PEZI|nr:hypothetical protein O1611_g5784 [Lasiodiplodia mahajangana]
MASGSQIPPSTTTTSPTTYFPFSLRPAPTHAPYDHTPIMASTSTNFPEPRKPCDINNLMSPPEPAKFESFGQPNTANHINSSMVSINDKAAKPTDAVMADVRRIPGPIPPLSPPISPATKLDDHVMDGVVTASQDPILYPANDITHSPPQQPLFVPEESGAASQIDKHISNRSAEIFKGATPPKRDDYEDFLRG